MTEWQLPKDRVSSELFVLNTGFTPSCFLGGTSGDRDPRRFERREQRSRGVGGGGGRLYLTLHCHHTE